MLVLTPTAGQSPFTQGYNTVWPADSIRCWTVLISRAQFVREYVIVLACVMDGMPQYSTSLLNGDETRTLGLWIYYDGR